MDKPKKISDEICKLVSKKRASYQLSDDELVGCGIDYTELNSVRKAINQAHKALDNQILRFFAGVFAPLGKLFDTLIKICIFILSFFAFVQMSSISEQADATLHSLVANASEQQADHRSLQDEISKVLQQYGVTKAEVKAPELREQIAESKHWLSYKDKTIADIWHELPGDHSKLKDLKVIYTKVLDEYKKPEHWFFSMPKHITAYKQALFGGILVLLSFIALQHIVNSSLKNNLKNNILKNNIKKVLGKSAA